MGKATGEKMNVGKAKEIVKKILHYIGVFLFGVGSALLLGSRIRNNGIGIDDDRGKQPDYSGEAEQIRNEARECREEIGEARNGIRDAREVATDTSRILQGVRERKKSVD